MTETNPAKEVRIIDLFERDPEALARSEEDMTPIIEYLREQRLKHQKEEAEAKTKKTERAKKKQPDVTTLKTGDV